MNSLQKIEYEILCAFCEVCEKLNLKYYLVCGSALGAAKYQGFIPWDDDIDVGMPRTDYEIFQKEAKRFLPPHIFLQNYETVPDYPLLFSKLIDKRTTFVEEGLSELNIYHGVYIDVFPLDGYPENKKEQIKLEKRKNFLKFKTLCAIRNNPGMKPITRILLKAERICGFHKKTAITLNRLTSLLSKYPVEKSAIWCNHGNWQGKLEYASCKQYGEGTWATFEGSKVRIPEKYDEYLTQKYGDWRADLSEEQKLGHHHAEIIDLTRPYTDYVVKLKNGRIRLKTSEELKSENISPPIAYKY